MNKKDAKTLVGIDIAMLASIASREKTNYDRNIYYDIATSEAIIYPEDDVDGLNIRPLRQRILKNGHRVNSDVGKFIADSIGQAILNSEDEDKKNA